MLAVTRWLSMEERLGIFNPAHLEVVPIRENILRGDTIAAKRAAQDTCVYGHPLTRRHGGGRFCQPCANRRSADHRTRNAGVSL